MKKLCTWKLLRTTRRIRIRTPFVCHASLAWWTCNISPQVHLSENVKHQGYFPGCFPPFVGTTYYRDWAHLTSLLVMSCIVMHLFAWYSLFLPHLLSGRLWDRRCCCPVRLWSWRPLLLARATRQAPPLITRYRLFFSLLLALEFQSNDVMDKTQS